VLCPCLAYGKRCKAESHRSCNSLKLVESLYNICAPSHFLRTLELPDDRICLCLELKLQPLVTFRLQIPTVGAYPSSNAIWIHQYPSSVQLRELRRIHTRTNGSFLSDPSVHHQRENKSKYTLSMMGVRINWEDEMRQFFFKKNIQIKIYPADRHYSAQAPLEKVDAFFFFKKKDWILRRQEVA
jgi:hypothetical protein